MNQCPDKLLIVINGKGGVGKDTMVEELAKRWRVRNVSSVDPIKEIARMCGWNGEKDNKSRKFLSDLKRVLIEYNDLPSRYLSSQCDKFATTDEHIMCIHIREEDQIRSFVSEAKLPCITVLVTRNTHDINRVYGNVSDDMVDQYEYDIEFDNIGSIEESGERFRDIIKKYIE